MMKKKGRFMFYLIRYSAVLRSNIKKNKQGFTKPQETKRNTNNRFSRGRLKNQN